MPTRHRATTGKQMITPSKAAPAMAIESGFCGRTSLADNVSHLAYRPQQFAGLHPYYAVVRSADVERPSDAFSQLIARFPEDFDKADQGLEPHVWRLAYYAPSITVHALADPSFAPAAYFAQPHVQDWLADVPGDWIDPDSVHELPEVRLRVQISTLSIDAAKAAWVVLSLMRSIPFDRGIITSTRWWRTESLIRLLSETQDPEPLI